MGSSGINAGHLHRQTNVLTGRGFDLLQHLRRSAGRELAVARAERAHRTADAHRRLPDAKHCVYDEVLCVLHPRWRSELQVQDVQSPRHAKLDRRTKHLVLPRLSLLTMST